MRFTHTSSRVSRGKPLNRLPMSSVLAAVIAGAVVILWALFGWHTLAEYGVETADAETDVATFAEADAEYAEIVIRFGGNPLHVIDEASDDPSTATSAEQHLLAQFRYGFRRQSGLRLHLERAGGHPASELTASWEAGRLLFVVPRPLVVFMVVAEWPESAALASWYSATEAEGGALSAISILMAILGTVLVRQLRQHEHAESARQELGRQVSH